MSTPLDTISIHVDGVVTQMLGPDGVPRSSPVADGQVLPVDPVDVGVLDVGGDGDADRRMESAGADRVLDSVAAQLVADRSLSSANISATPRGASSACSLASTSPAVASTSVIGSAATTTHLQPSPAASSRTRSAKASALAKNNGASNGKMTRPGISRASG